MRYNKQPLRVVIAAALSAVQLHLHHSHVGCALKHDVCLLCCFTALSKRGIRLRMPDAEAERALAVKDWQLKYTLQTTTSEASHPQLHMYLAGMASVYHAVGLLEQAVCCR